MKQSKVSGPTKKESGLAPSSVRIYPSPIEVGRLEETYQPEQYSTEKATHVLYEFANRGAEKFFTLETEWSYEYEADFDDLAMTARLSYDPVKKTVTFYKKMQLPGDKHSEKAQVFTENKYLTKTRSNLQTDAFVKIMVSKNQMSESLKVERKEDDSFVLSELSPPDKLSVHGVTLQAWSFSRIYREVTWPQGPNEEPVVVKKPQKIILSDAKLGDFYKLGSAISRKLPDGTFVHYMVDLSVLFAKLKEITGDSYDCFQQPPKRDWSPEYARFRLVENPSLSNSPVWKTLEGFTLYEVPRPLSVELSYYQGEVIPGQSPAYLHIKDPFGRIIECFNSTGVKPMIAEPLLYFYPTKASEVRLTFDKSVRLVSVVPDLNLQNGWQFFADPSGNLKVSTSSQPLRYLFWEGYSSLLPPSKEGFIFKASEVLGALPGILDHFALNPQEKRDFIRYWSQRLTYAPYYQLYFYSQEQVHQMVPIQITPTPDQFIRIIMEVTPLYRPVERRQQVLPSFKRSSGFSVIEWGGFLR